MGPRFFLKVEDECVCVCFVFASIPWLAGFDEGENYQIETTPKDHIFKVTKCITRSNFRSTQMYYHYQQTKFQFLFKHQPKHHHSHNQHLLPNHHTRAFNSHHEDEEQGGE
ncbi:hypothetical protein L6452_35338 [Arctium lappa]|uniref:Uncharacterized protein n=1 Tax=Arctium lappa TaxID=4217 RepID=A0ACB8Y661_ARCLA|nr:hypothetical protein L6452_35338 [Arctium lappa]